MPVVLIAAGGAIELVQLLIGRDAQMGDWIAEIIAVGLAWGVVRVWSRLSPRAKPCAPRGRSGRAARQFPT